LQLFQLISAHHCGSIDETQPDTKFVLLSISICTFTLSHRTVFQLFSVAH